MNTFALIKVDCLSCAKCLQDCIFAMDALAWTCSTLMGPFFQHHTATNLRLNLF
jgi:hypothetical protein